MRVMGMRVLPVALLVAYAALLLFDLERFPAINPDEPGYAEPAWTLITRGEFGAPMYAGMFGMEHRLYIICPGRGVVTTLPYLLFGPTLFAARLVSVAMAVLLAVLSAIFLRRVLDRHLKWVDWLALVAVMTCPVVVGAGRFARPEIDVAAWTMAMLVCLEAHFRAGTRLRRRGWATAGGLCAGLAVVMHQYGLVSLGAGFVIMVAPRYATLRTRLGGVAWLATGIALAVSPWAAFILSDLTEFRLQLEAQAAFQAWRYPATALANAVINEIPGRYLLDRQDYPANWEPWSEATRLLVPTVSMSEPWWHLRLAVRVVRRPMELGPLVLDRLWWMGIVLVVVGISATSMVKSRFANRLAILSIPTSVWAFSIALVPNKWIGYAVTLIVMSGLSGYVLVSRQASVLPIRRGWIELPLIVTILLNGSALIAVWTETPPSRKLVVEALHAAIPPGARVLGPGREWYAFVGRNPAIGVDGRSLPQYGTTLTQSAKEFGAEYVVLIRDGSGAAPFYWVDEREPLVARVADSTGRPDDGVVLRSNVAGEEVVVTEVR
jgi:4-amino-4-deoxy-L-arabinose transferase-like glycosyltransferase